MALPGLVLASVIRELNCTRSNRFMKVLVIATDGFGGHGGIALYVRNVLHALSEHPRRPQVVALPHTMRFAPEPLPANLEWDTSGLGGKARYAAAVARAALRRGPFDAVLCTHIHLLPLAYPIARVQRAPLALFVYGIEAKPPARRKLAHRLIAHTDGIISIRHRTTQALRSWASIDGTPVYLLENAIDLSLYGAAPKDPELVARLGLAGKRVVMTLSRLAEPYIGVDEILGALGRLPSAARDVVYLVAGDGPDLPRLREKARTLGVADRVVFTGYVPDDNKADYYRLADVYAMPGSGAAFDRYPLRFAFLEAMACGVPVVGAICEEEHERNTDGALLAAQVDPRDPQAIADAIMRALAAPKAVPPSLARYDYPAFRERCHGVLDRIWARQNVQRAPANEPFITQG
jgi:glycosyltransferase involved in cell wall biosynthesis